VDSATTTFVYNGDGLRDALTFDSNTTTFTWDVNRSIPQVLDDETYQYLYGLGRIAQVGASETHYYLSDGLGSTLALTDEAGDIVNTYDYDVFGAPRAESGSQANDFTFAGEQVDGSTGLQYLRARYYDPEAGRFLSRDPLSGIVGLPSSQNRYPYVLSSPINLLDPSGLCVFGAPCPKPIKQAADALSSAGNVFARAVKYCATNEHIVECYERLEVGTVGVFVAGAGVGIVVGGCFFVAPIVGAATAGVAGVASCGLSIAAGGGVFAGGVLTIRAAFIPWHHGSEHSLRPSVAPGAGRGYKARGSADDASPVQLVRPATEALNGRGPLFGSGLPMGGKE
jgi:RHS repeat-associated protein